MSQSSKPIPIAMPNDLLIEIDEVSTLTGLSKQDVMRLCMRIGVIDLKAADHDLPGLVKKIADDKGVSFQAFAKNASQTGGDLVKGRPWTQSTPASTADSASPSPTSDKATTVPPVKLPPQHVVALNEAAAAPPPATETRAAAVKYHRPRRAGTPKPPRP